MMRETHGKDGDGLIVENLRKSWGVHDVFPCISFSQSKGTIYGVTGENGSGKSTLLKVIAAIIPPDCGSVRFGGETQKNRIRWSSMIGYVPQELALDERFSVRNTLLFWAAARGFPAKERARWVSIAERDPLIASFLDKKICDCSGGMARRCSLLVGLLGDPPLLLLDEPFAGADETSRSLMAARLLDYKARGHTILISSHEKDLLGALCDRQLVLHDGELSDAPDWRSAGGAAFFSEDKGQSSPDGDAFGSGAPVIG